MSQEDRGKLSEIDRDECFQLLAGHPVGRVAMAVEGDGPLVVPVNFSLDGEAIVFRSDPGMKIRLLRQGPVSFQVDEVDWYHRTGWSVLARGVAYEATHWEVDHVDVKPWAEGDKGHWVRIVVREITGRRLEHGELSWPGDGRGYL
jgi:nitroimidazol reductase NimA-like FMN-containing flavoprotein (pyridoxamine 5'-phosphate oxidase superfamily)